MEVISMEVLRRDKKYTYADYMSWPEDERWELIDGVAYMLAAPNVAHQSISFEIGRQLGNFLRGKPCRAFSAPFSVRLADDSVVEPDISIVCDQSKLSDGKTCNGAPDMVIEILSPSSTARDKVLKFNKYLHAGVREYWVVYPDSKTVSVYVLKDGRYMASEYADTDTVPAHVLDGCTINLPDVFAGT
jgi:Uma2 family endonuclease